MLRPRRAPYPQAPRERCARLLCVLAPLRHAPPAPPRTAAAPDPVGNSRRIWPVLASKARNLRSLVPPANSRPPPVASTGPQLNDGKLVVHTFFPLSRSHACNSPMWSAPATIFITFFATPMKRSPCTYLGASPVSSVHKLSLAGM